VLVGREREGVLFRAAAATAPEPPLIGALDALFGLETESTLRYEDARRGIGRRIRLENGRIEAARLAGDAAAEPWLRDLFEQQEPVSSFGALLLAPAARIPAGPSRGKVICSCFGVGERTICDFLADTGNADRETLARLQSALKCGTNCGSCVPELKRLVATAMAAA